MFEGNSLSVTYRLRDLESRCTPQLGSYRPKGRAAKLHAAATLLAYAFVGLLVGAAYLA